MIKKERRKHLFSDRLRYMHMLESGFSIESVSKKTGIDRHLLSTLWENYKIYGTSSLQKHGKIKADFSLKKEVILDIQEKGLSLQAATVKYGASYDAIKVWLRKYRQGGFPALASAKKIGRPPGMGRPRKNSKSLTELERLRKENQELKTENALLKKVRALVEERNARLRAIGQKPSKN